MLIIEGHKRSSGFFLKQCCLALKDAADNNGRGVVYGFITTGDTLA